MCWINLLCASQELNQSCPPWLSSYLCQPVYFIAGMCCVSLRWHFENISTKRTIFIKNLGDQHWRHGLYMFLEGHIKWIRDLLNGFNYQHWNKISAKKAKYNCSGNGFGILEVSLFLTSGKMSLGLMSLGCGVILFFIKGQTHTRITNKHWFQQIDSHSVNRALVPPLSCPWE